MKNWFLSNVWIVAGVLLGAVAGYIYWQQVGCDAGTCRITSKWTNSTAYGALMGGLFFSLFKKERNNEHGNRA
jgi:predicted negative regulator of RcsB-dependent stress response